jgi:putative DNA primase/helicase
VYPETLTTWEEVDQVPDPEEAVNYLNVARRISDATPESLGAEIGIDGTPFLRFSNEDGAQDLFRRWLKKLMNRVRSGDEHPVMEAHLGKYPGLVPSLALIFHLVDVGSGPVRIESLRRALKYAAYLEGHARRIFASRLEEDISVAKLILQKLQIGKLGLTFRARDIYRSQWSGLTNREVVASGLKCLQEFGYVQEYQEETGFSMFCCNPELD